MERENDIGFLIKRIDRKAKARMDASLNRYGLTFSQSQILFLLYKNGGRLTQKQLQDLMNVSHPTIVGLIQRLEANGFVRSYADREDRRCKIVERTEKAELFGKDMDFSRRKAEKAMLKGLSEEEIVTLSKLLNKVYENVCEVKDDQDIK